MNRQNNIEVRIFRNPATLAVFPNPVKDKFNINYLGEENMDIQMNVLDVIGKSVVSKKEKANAKEQMNYTLDLQSLIPGVYLVHPYNAQKGLNTTFKITRIN